MAVDFVAHADQQSVKFGSQAVGANCTEATLNKYTAYFCTALMTGLDANTSYTYQLGSDTSAWTAPIAFVNEPSARPLIFAVYADFGYGCVLHG